MNAGFPGHIYARGNAPSWVYPLLFSVGENVRLIFRNRQSRSASLGTHPWLCVWFEERHDKSCLAFDGCHPLYRKFDHLISIFKPQFLLNVGAVGFDGLHAKVESLTDLACRFVTAEKLQHLDLPV